MCDVYVEEIVKFAWVSGEYFKKKHVANSINTHPIHVLFVLFHSFDYKVVAKFFHNQGGFNCTTNVILNVKL